MIYSSIQNELKKQLNIKPSKTLPNLKNDNASIMFYNDSQSAEDSNETATSENDSTYFRKFAEQQIDCNEYNQEYNQSADQNYDQYGNQNYNQNFNQNNEQTYQQENNEQGYNYGNGY